MKVKWLLNFPPELTGEPVTYALIKNFNLKINILKASIDLNVSGNLLVLADGTRNEIDSALAWLRNTGVSVDPGDSQIVWNEVLCVHCGACTAICPTKALSLDPLSWMVAFEGEKCLECGHCVPACPIGAISNNKGLNNA